MKKFPIGLCSVSFRKHSPAEILQEMQRASLNVIEWGSDIHAPAGDEKALKELASLQALYGVTCSSYGTYFKIGTTPAEKLTDYIRAARILGTSVLRLWAGSKNSEEFDEGEKEAFFKECLTLATLATKEGVTLCMECHNKTYTNRFQSALELMQAIHSSHFRMYWQPNQFRSDEENLASAEALAPYTENIHLFHWRGKEKFPLAQGKALWKNYLKHFQGNQTLLLEFMPDGRLESLNTEADCAKMIREEMQ
ncbi:MAG: hypothetical protein E7580_02070 [Ruminococcaceae bacterium]|nr:hypothetical protein [Oscillospiraceae bacterium]